VHKEIVSKCFVYESTLSRLTTIERYGILIFNMNILEAIALGALQGITEFLPISSSGHLIVARDFFGITIENNLLFDVFLHGATLLSIIVYFRRDIFTIIRNLFVSERSVEGDGEEEVNVLSVPPRRFLFLLVVATVPAVVVGLLIRNLEEVMRTSGVVATSLIIGGIIIFLAEKFEIKRESKSKLTLKSSVIIGCFQVLSLIPGMSRSGMAISGGFLSGLSREHAIRFSFLLALPVIGGLVFLGFIDILRLGVGEIDLPAFISGAIAAFAVGIFVIHFLIHFLERNTFTVFIIYRMFLAVLIFAFLF